MNKEIMLTMGFNKEVKAIAEKKCPTCFKPINMKDFKDNLSLKEYKISGMCQKCQDSIFGE